MKTTKFEKIISMVIAVFMMCSMVADVFSVKAYATTELADETQLTEETVVCSRCGENHSFENCTVKCTKTGHTDHTADKCPDNECTRCGGKGHLAENCSVPDCTLCGGVHNILDCDKKCAQHGTDHLDVNCPRHLTCELCKENGHKTDDCPQQCSVHGTEHLDKDCDRHKLTCTLCGLTGHEASSCPDKCTKHGAEHLEKDCPNNFATNDNVYIANYQVVNNSGKALAKVNPGDKVIIAVTIIDERVTAEEFAFKGNNVETDRIHATMTQGAFSIASADKVKARMRDSVTVKGANGNYQALCYTLEFRDVTYLGGNPDFGFSVAYTDYDKDPSKTNNIPMPYPYTPLNITVTQATDDIPAPTIILNSANYGKVAIIGEPFSLVTAATNTSENLELENVSLRIDLPQGITLANGNSQVLIGDVGKKGTINHTFNLIAEGVANDVTSLPVKLVYTFEAFVSGKRTQFTSEQDISINVQQPTRFDIQSVMNDIEMFMGNESYASVSLVNKGKTTVYNVTAELVSDTLTAYDVEFLGNITPGTSTEASFDFTASQVGTATGKILVTYEDASGTQSTLEQTFTIEVLEEMVWDEPVYTDPVIEPEQPQTPVALIAVGVVAVAAAGGFVFYKKKKAKKLAEAEDEDEDI